MSLRSILIIFAFLPLISFSRDITVKGELYWDVAHDDIIEGKVSLDYLICDQCLTSGQKAGLPQHSRSFDLSRNEVIRSVRFTSLKTEEVTGYEFKADELAGISLNEPEVEASNGFQRDRNRGLVSFVPLIRTNGTVLKIVSYEIIVEVEYRQRVSNKALQTFSQNSVLSQGYWFKLGVDHDGLFKISYKFLKDKGVDVNNIDPRNIGVFGNHGAMLPRANSDARPDDLMENAIYVSGESDGSFDKGDYILFYAQGTTKWTYDNANKVWHHQVNEYSDTSYYFLTTDQGFKRINQVTSTNSPSSIVREFDDFSFHEVDQVNLLNSGDDWLGELFDVQTSFTFTFSFPNVVSSQAATLKASVVSACKQTSNWSVSVGGKSMGISVGGAPGGYANLYAIENTGEMTFNPTSDVLNVVVNYIKPSGLSSAKGWMDYLELNARRSLSITATQLEFRDQNSLNSGFVRYDVSNAKNATVVWEVTDPFNPVQHLGSLSAGKYSFVASTDLLRSFIAVNDYDSTYHWQGQVPNQNLHADRNYDYIIVSHPRFLAAAQRLQLLHQSKGLDVVVTTPQMIYNEFSSGAQDIVAIRDYARMMYNRYLTSGGKPPKYMLFMGDGSVDNKYRISGNTNYIPTFESDESYDSRFTYVSDDFYCMLDSGEGTWVNNNELMDISVGRMPVQTLDQANAAVTKIERYISSQSMQDWRNKVCFVGDDEDGNLHMRQSNTLATAVDTLAPVYDVEKIFIDAYKEYATPGGQRYPDALEAIKRQVQNGVLIMSYTGHGGEVGWAHERILTLNEINGWTNKYSMPLFLTATCEFSRWDDPGRTSAGELVFLNPDGGGIALMTTVRLVYASGNFAIASEFFQDIFKKNNGDWPRLGDVYMDVKNGYRSDNTRNFTLLGDPALQLDYPTYNVVTTEINGNPIGVIDTIGALGLVEVKGYVADNNNAKMTSFNGIIHPTVFDKRYEVTTLNNDGAGAFHFTVQNKRLFRGKASVTAGDFSFKFVVPKDIAYNFDRGKISYYAQNQLIDAHGFTKEFVVGGTDPNAADDKKGPEIQLFMNDYNFVYGGLTDENPLFIAKVYDEHGINMAGTGIGHNITVVLDGKTDNIINLNDYYSAAVNSYQEGEVRYPFENLAPGTHKLTFKVWDVYNNSTEEVLEFVVQQYKDITLNRVLNYPNPFTTNTSFWFEHNQPNTVLDVKVQIFTVSGKVVKTIDKVVQTAGYSQNRQDPISWDGLDEYGDKLARGVYIYKLQVRSRRNNTKAEKIEKLVIL